MARSCLIITSYVQLSSLLYLAVAIDVQLKPIVGTPLGVPGHIPITGIERIQLGCSQTLHHKLVFII